MNIAILGATSQIAKDLILSISRAEDYSLTLFARRPEVVDNWLNSVDLKNRYTTYCFNEFHSEKNFNVVINFVGVGNPAQAIEMGNTIFDITLEFDSLALKYLYSHPDCRYIFLSSGAAYGANFYTPVDEESKAIIPLNHFQPQDWYSLAKLYSECRHRSLHEYSIVDIRIFNYFSRTQDMSARFLMTDIVRAIHEKVSLKISADSMTRDFLHPSDFYGLLNSILTSPPANAVVDCYSKGPIEKLNLLSALHDRFALQYELINTDAGLNATGSKPFYYSKNRSAEKFGYTPRLTALESVIMEIDAYMKDVNLNLSGNNSYE